MRIFIICHVLGTFWKKNSWVTAIDALMLLMVAAISSLDIPITTVPVYDNHSHKRAKHKVFFCSNVLVWGMTPAILRVYFCPLPCSGFSPLAYHLFVDHTENAYLSPMVQNTNNLQPRRAWGPTFFPSVRGGRHEAEPHVGVTLPRPEVLSLGLGRCGVLGFLQTGQT